MHTKRAFRYLCSKQLVLVSCLSGVWIDGFSEDIRVMDESIKSEEDWNIAGGNATKKSMGKDKRFMVGLFAGSFSLLGNCSLNHGLRAFCY